eukprot:365036-Chlamydomonas_euryale.AAC.6
MDRPALNGFEIIEQLEKEFSLPAYPINWPIGSGDRFCGVFHRPTGKVSQRGDGFLGGCLHGVLACLQRKVAWLPLRSLPPIDQTDEPGRYGICKGGHASSLNPKP